MTERERIEPELARWPAVFTRVEPLPGGLFALRRRLREPRRARHAWAIAATSGAALAVVLVLALALAGPRHRAAEDVSHLVNRRVPHPELIELGLAPPRALVEQARDPRIDDGVVVFRWVQPARPGRDTATP